jgi:hypothetical protein
MDRVHKPITTQYYTPSSKPFRIYLSIMCFTPLKINVNVLHLVSFVLEEPSVTIHIRRAV